MALAIDVLAFVYQRSGNLTKAALELARAAALNREFGDLPRLLWDQMALGDLKLWLESWAIPSEPPPHAWNRFMSGLPAHLLAQGLGLGAGAFALDAACASSLYAIKLACDRLQDWVEEAAAGRVPEAGETLALFEQQVQALATLPERPEPPPAPEVGKAAAVRDIPEDAAQLVEKREEAPGQSFIRVDPELLDALVNSAGEINILRSRLERQIGNGKSLKMLA